MTQAEKSRAYDEALERARKLKENPQMVFYEYSPKEGDTICDYIFPELKESEDEKIRKELIDYHRSMAAQADDYVHEAWIIWLEKQSEQKPVISNDALREGIAHFGITQYQIDNWLKRYVNVEKQGEQKPAWSEEDERMFDYALDMIEWYSGKNEDKSRLVSDWLKSLRPQPKQKWNEEDEEMFKSLKTLLNNASCYSCTEGVDKILSWLKSLKGRVLPQPKQEWSEEDQNALEDVREAVVHYWGGETQDILLYWLKSIKQKIKGE